MANYLAGSMSMLVLRGCCCSKNVIDRQLKVCSGRESESKPLVSV